MKNDIKIGSIVEFISNTGHITIAVVVSRKETQFSKGLIPVLVTLQANHPSIRKNPKEAWAFDFDNTSFKTSLLGNKKTHPEYLL